MGAVTYRGQRRADIDELFWYWQDVIGYPITANVTKNRYAIHRLSQRHSQDQLKRLIDGVALTYHDRYAPQIADFVQLEYKLQSLLAWGKRRGQSNSETIEV